MRIHHRAVLVAAIVHWIVGGIWYGVFTSPFARYMGEEKLKEIETHNEPLAFSLAFVSSWVIAYVLAHFLKSSDGPGQGFKSILLVWFGSILATNSLTVLFEGRHPGLYVLNVSYQLVACSLVGVILMAWKPRPTRSERLAPIPSHS